ncbi:mini-ribonuclease 3 [Clostridium saccharobutylicum]|uniref:Mini-ribonuclease 3 n=2 Tax=Clostridium saccharobutylicum TaxID=169679 RepID=A0A1S8N431_CLOSA|nr:mini-ribonuclease 3 [Clostridium saccharobutylicum]
MMQPLFKGDLLMLDDFRMREFTKNEARMLNPLQLALVGDGVFEVFIRDYILAENMALSANKIHIKAIRYVKAKSQAYIMHQIEEILTEEEMAVYKRGRNAKSATVPKNADVRDYRMATGFEALVGYLYLIGDKERLELIFNKSIEVIK